MSCTGSWLWLALAAAACSPADHPASMPSGSPSGQTEPGPALQIMGDSYKHRRGDPLPAKSALFDGERVTLRAVRGETLGVQVLVAERAGRVDAGERMDHADPGRSTRPEISVSLSLAAPGVTVTPFRMDWIEVREPSTWMYGPSRGPGWYPDRLEPVHGAVGSQGGAFFDVTVDALARPGSYTGALAVADRSIPITLTIEPITIDLYPQPLVWVWYMPSELALSHDLADRSPAAIALEHRYSELFRAHGAYISGAWVPAELPPREDLIREVSYVPVLVDRSGDMARLEAGVAEWIALFAGRPQLPFAIPIDEPRTRARRHMVKTWSEHARRAGSGRDRFLFAVTDQPRELYGDTVDVFISWKGIPARGSHPVGRRWTYNGTPGHAGSMIIDTGGAALRSWGWIAYRYDVPLWYAWAGMYYRDVYNQREASDVLVDPLTFRDRSDRGNGDGLLAYPGAVPSLRLKALRRGLQDRLLLRALAGCGGRERAFALALRMIPAALGDAIHGAAPRWPEDEPSWERARLELLDALGSICG